MVSSSDLVKNKLKCVMGVASDEGAHIDPGVSKKIFVALENTFVGGIFVKIGDSSVSEDEDRRKDSISIISLFL